MPGKSPTAIPQLASPPSEAHAKIQSQVGGLEQSFQATISLSSNPLQEGKSRNLREGKGETSMDVEAELQLLEQRSPEILDLGSAVKPARVSNSLFITEAPLQIPEDYWHIFDQMVEHPPQGQTSTLEYPIVDQVANAPMKAIPLQNIPTFHGMITKDHDAFLFEFDVLCRGYDYNTNPQKLKLFHSTLKGAALIWFMGLGG